MTVAARIFVLATGGIENARLLLASNNVQAAGLGNANDLVGRYFMDHPRMMCGKVRFRPGNARNKLYDIKYHYQNAAVSAHGTKISSQFAPKQELMEREKLLNSRVWLYSRWYGEGTAGSEALIHCKEALLQKDQPGRSLKTDIATMIAHPLHTVGYGLTRLLQWPVLITDVTLQAIVEAVPDPDSRVTLSADQRDRFGMPRVKVEWRLGEQVKRTFDRTFALLAQELQMAGIADVELDAPLEGRPLAGEAGGHVAPHGHHAHARFAARRGGRSRLQGAWHQQSLRGGQLGVSDRRRQFPDHHDRRACAASLRSSGAATRGAGYRRQRTGRRREQFGDVDSGAAASSRARCRSQPRP